MEDIDIDPMKMYYKKRGRTEKHCKLIYKTLERAYLQDVPMGIAITFDMLDYMLDLASRLSNDPKLRDHEHGGTFFADYLKLMDDDNNVKNIYVIYESKICPNIADDTKVSYVPDPYCMENVVSDRKRLYYDMCLDFHTHPDYSLPSPVDLYFLYEDITGMSMRYRVDLSSAVYRPEFIITTGEDVDIVSYSFSPHVLVAQIDKYRVLWIESQPLNKWVSEETYELFLDEAMVFGYNKGLTSDEIDEFVHLCENTHIAIGSVSEIRDTTRKTYEMPIFGSIFGFGIFRRR